MQGHWTSMWREEAREAEDAEIVFQVLSKDESIKPGHVLKSGLTVPYRVSVSATADFPLRKVFGSF